MFTVKIIDREQDNEQVRAWREVRHHGPLSLTFDTLKDIARNNAETSDVAEAVEQYYGWIGDGEGNEYWLVIGEDCFVTDHAGKTVMSIRSPEVLPDDGER